MPIVGVSEINETWYQKIVEVKIQLKVLFCLFFMKFVVVVRILFKPQFN